MRHNDATVFSHKDGVVGFAPPPPPGYWCPPDPGRVRRCCTMLGAPRSRETMSSNDYSRRALCCLDLIWEKALLALAPLPRGTRATQRWRKTGGEKLQVT